MLECVAGHRVTTHGSPGLPLLCAVVVCVMWHAEARPLDFVCDRGSRRRAVNSVAQMQTDLSACGGGGGVTLSTEVRLPCIKVHKASWEGKSHQEKRGDIIASLGLLGEDVRAAVALTAPGCVSALLQSLEHSLTNYQHILAHLELSGAVESPLTSSCVPQSSPSLSTVLWAYSRLITGKLEWLVVTLEDRCTPSV
ncbi:unnamed protein product [Boreogadus saida]